MRALNKQHAGSVASAVRKFKRIQMQAILRDYRHASDHALGAAEQGSADDECLSKLAPYFHGLEKPDAS